MSARVPTSANSTLDSSGGEVFASESLELLVASLNDSESDIRRLAFAVINQLLREGMFQLSGVTRMVVIYY